MRGSVTERITCASYVNGIYVEGWRVLTSDLNLSNEDLNHVGCDFFIFVYVNTMVSGYLLLSLNLRSFNYRYYMLLINEIFS